MEGLAGGRKGVKKMSIVHVKKLHPDAKVPTYGSCEAAGADLYACLEAPVTVAPGQTVWIPTGLAIEIPRGYAGLVYARSGMACKKGLAPANKVGVIDSDYRGPVTVVLYNHGEEPQTIYCGDRVAQLVITPVLQVGFETVDELDDTARGQGGFGSTGQ